VLHVNRKGDEKHISITFAYVQKQTTKCNTCFVKSYICILTVIQLAMKRYSFYPKKKVMAGAETKNSCRDLFKR
jgi:hypothetical protein